MPYNSSTYSGDAIYSIDCTGDAVCGDEIRFERATFSGSFRNAKFSGFEQITGKIIRDSYGRDKQQHTFSIETATDLVVIKGRNVYSNGTWRKPWFDEATRKSVADEKHDRGQNARRARQARQAGTVYQ